MLRYPSQEQHLLDSRCIIRNRTFDGFLDFKIFVRLCILELKLTVFPSLPSTKKPESERSPGTIVSRGQFSPAAAMEARERLFSHQGSVHSRHEEMAQKMMEARNYGSMKQHTKEQLEAQVRRQLQEVEEREIEQLLKFFVSPEDYSYDDGD